MTLSWDAPASDSDITRHEYDFKTTGGYPETWTQIPNSGVGGANEDGHTVTGLTNEVAHTFQLRAVKDGGVGTAAQSGPVTPTPGICDRTQQVQDLIVTYVNLIFNSDHDCSAVNAEHLARLNPDPAMGAIWGGVLGGECGVDGEGAREREVSSFGGHGSAAMRRPEANRRRVSARRVAAGDMGPGIVGGTCMARVAAARLRRAPGAGCRGSVPAGP